VMLWFHNALISATATQVSDLRPRLGISTSC
jgi:hypothetical protein